MIRVVHVAPLADYQLRVRFSDGLEGVYAVEPHRRGGVFEQLLDPTVFKNVSVNDDFGCIEWPGGIDLCPIAMHDAVTAANAPGSVIRPKFDRVV